MEEIIRILSGLLTPIIAGITVYIAYQQWRTNKNRLKLELYNKRYDVYLSLRELLYRVIHGGKVEFDDIKKFNVGIVESGFLFKEEIVSYLREICNKALDLYAVQASCEKLEKEAKRDESVERESNLKEWFEKQVEIASLKFGKYLNLREL